MVGGAAGEPDIVATADCCLAKNVIAGKVGCSGCSNRAATLPMVSTAVPVTTVSTLTLVGARRLQVPTATGILVILVPPRRPLWCVLKGGLTEDIRKTLLIDGAPQGLTAIADVWLLMLLSSIAAFNSTTATTSSIVH